MSDRTCSVEGCEKRASGRMCAMHAKRLYLTGSVGPVGTAYRRRPWAERFWEKVEKTPTCWNWTASTQRDGYGVFETRGTQHRSRHTHRIVYELLVGPIPDGMELDHLCRNRACCNPAHLEPVPHGENCVRGVGFGGINARKTHCASGHPYDGDNLYIHPDGSRRCRACDRERARAQWRRRSEDRVHRQPPVAPLD
jgi:hypothetical protein